MDEPCRRLWTILLGASLLAPSATLAQTGAASLADRAWSQQDDIETVSDTPDVSAESATLALAPDAVVSPGPMPEAQSAAPPDVHAPGGASWGLLFRRAILGQLVAAVPGVLVGGVVGLASCSDGEGWISGFTCEAGVGYSVTISAMAAAPLGAAIAIHHASSSRGAHGSFWAALGGAYAAVALGAGLSAIVIAAADEPTWGALAGGVVAAVLTPILGIEAYRATVSTSLAGSEHALLAPWLSVERDGASLGLMGVL